MDHEKFKNIAGGIQSLTIAAAVVIAGAWSVLVLGEDIRARAEIEKLKQSKVALELSIEVEPIDRAAGDERDLIVEVRIRNTGYKHLTLDLRNPSLQARRVRFDPRTGLKEFGAPISTHYYGPSVRPYRTITVIAGSSRALPFYIKVPSPGIYLLTFRSPMSGDLARDIGKLPVGSPPLSNPFWLSQKIIHVQ